MNEYLVDCPTKFTYYDEHSQDYVDVTCRDYAARYNVWLKDFDYMLEIIQDHLVDAGVLPKLSNITISIIEDDGGYFTRATHIFDEPLSNTELELVKDNWCLQMSDGWGEEIERRSVGKYVNDTEYDCNVCKGCGYIEHNYTLDDALDYTMPDFPTCWKCDSSGKIQDSETVYVYPNFDCASITICNV